MKITTEGKTNITTSKSHPGLSEKEHYAFMELVKTIEQAVAIYYTATGSWIHKIDFDEVGKITTIKDGEV